jgi:hypothetical protein
VKMYASLTGPLVGIYFPLPEGDEADQRLLLNNSKLKSLWCAIYTEAQVDDLARDHAGIIKLPQSFAMKLL